MAIIFYNSRRNKKSRSFDSYIFAKHVNSSKLPCFSTLIYIMRKCLVKKMPCGNKMTRNIEYPKCTHNCKHKSEQFLLECRFKAYPEATMKQSSLFQVSER